MIGLVMMLCFHFFISAHLPMGTPILWNVMMVAGGFFLFGHHAAISAFSIQSPLLIALLLFCLVFLQVVGNIWPRYISFLLSMRYYAGNWAYSVWLFENKCQQKLDQHLTKCSPLVERQLEKVYGPKIAQMMLLRALAFRNMHLHGRLLQLLVPQAVKDIENYTWVEGELVAGLALGWNFGEGHLHDEQLLTAIQKRCGFESGELRVVMVESQPFFRPSHRWRIVDAKDGQVAAGETFLSEVIDRQPWEAYGPSSPPASPQSP